MFKGEEYYDRLYNDPISADEIEIYIENEGSLYKRSFLPIIKNIKRKIASGKYEHKLAPKLWSYLIEAGMKGYAKDFGEAWNTLLSTKDRKILAMKLADYYYDQILTGEYDGI